MNWDLCLWDAPDSEQVSNPNLNPSNSQPKSQKKAQYCSSQSPNITVFLSKNSLRIAFNQKNEC